MGYIRQKLWDIFGKLWDIYGKYYRIYWLKIIGYFMGYIRQKLWDILGQNYGIYFGIYWFKIVGYIWKNNGIYWSIGYNKQKVRDIYVA